MIVRQLERRAQVDRVLARTRIGVAEDLDAAEADGRGHPIAIRIQVFGGLVACAVEIHRDPVDDRQERVARDRERAHRVRQPCRDRIGRGGAGLVAERHVAAPAVERAPLLGAIGPALVAEIRDVVHGPAEGGTRRTARRGGAWAARETRSRSSSDSSASGGPRGVRSCGLPHARGIAVRDEPLGGLGERRPHVGLRQ